MAVRRRLCRLARGDETVRACAILHNYRLAEGFGELGGDLPCPDVRRAAGDRWHEDFERTSGKSLRGRRAAAQRRSQGNQL